jgi:DNA-binding transcriptional LysR family regulator
MDLQTLRTFVEVVRQGGFSRAAKAVFLTQSTVSKAVKQLEIELGVTLLDRKGHRTTLTADGDVVYRRALKILEEREDLITELNELRGLKLGTLRLGLAPVSSSDLFAPLFATYRSRYPGVDIRLVEHGGQRLKEILRSGEIEVAASLLPVSDEFEWQSVAKEPLMVLLPAEHAFAGKKSIDLVSLQHLPFILFERGFGLHRIILEACRRRGFEPTVVATSSQIDFIVSLVAAGLGIAFLPRMVAEQRRHPSVRLVRLAEPQTEWNAAMIWRRDAYLSHAAKAWLAIVRESYAKGARGKRPKPLLVV